MGKWMIIMELSVVEMRSFWWPILFFCSFGQSIFNNVIDSFYVLTFQGSGGTGATGLWLYQIPHHGRGHSFIQWNIVPFTFIHKQLMKWVKLLVNGLVTSLDQSCLHYCTVSRFLFFSFFLLLGRFLNAFIEIFQSISFTDLRLDEDDGEGSSWRRYQRHLWKHVWKEEHRAAEGSSIVISSHVMLVICYSGR